MDSQAAFGTLGCGPVTLVRWDGETMPTLVVFGGNGNAVLLGAYTLEGFALAPDPVNQRLVKVRGLAMGNRDSVG